MNVGDDHTILLVKNQSTVNLKSESYKVCIIYVNKHDVF